MNKKANNHPQPFSHNVTLSPSLPSPDTLAQGCEGSSDVSADIQWQILNQEAVEEKSKAGGALLCPAGPESEQHAHQNTPPSPAWPELESTSQG